MRVGNYSLMVPEGVEKDSGHIGLPHGTQYTLKAGNHDARRCDAEVRIDGKEIGVFRLSPHGSLKLERSPDDHGKFTFYADGTADAQRAGLATVDVPDRGLIQVWFIPEVRRPPVSQPQQVMRGMSFNSGGPLYGAVAGGQSQSRSLGYDDEPVGSAEKTCGGITGLSGHSGQQFASVGPIDRDEAAAVTISVRLILRDDGPRPLQAAPRGNPVPSPV